MVLIFDFCLRSCQTQRGAYFQGVLNFDKIRYIEKLQKIDLIRITKC